MIVSTSSRRFLSVLSLAMITIVSVDSVRNLPASALFGAPLIFFFILAGLTFLIPTALVAAELATGWPSRGGVYTWVKSAFGEKIGLIAIWFQWIENVIWYPTILAFIAGTFAYLLFPTHIHNPYYMSGLILIVFWLSTIVNLCGLRFSASLSIFCSIAGLLLPMAFIIGLGMYWLWIGAPLQISLQWADIVPDLSDPTLLMSLTAVVLSCCGMEITAVHAQEVEDPQRDYPRALLSSTAIILVTLILGSLAIALVIPAEEISLVAGLMQAFDGFLNAYGLEFLLPVLGLSLIIGGLGGLNSWIVAPSKGLLIALKELNIMPVLHSEKADGTPTALLIVQALICSVLSLIFLLLPTINSGYWFLTALASQLYMLMYLLMFAAAIYLRIKKPEVPRGFKIPGGVWGVGLVGGVGILSAGLTFFLGFYPAIDLPVHQILIYQAAIIGGLILMSVPPFIAYRRHNQIPIKRNL